MNWKSRMLALLMIFALTSINCSEDKVTNPGDDSVDYVLIEVSATSGFLMGWEGIEDDEEPVHTVALDSYEIGKYEITYEVWSTVKEWAESNGYTFANRGREGGCTAASCSTTDQHPVTTISWRDCIAWCNAFSEYEGLTPVYYKTSSRLEYYTNSATDGDIDNDCVNWTGNGYRLPTEAEWEYAARYLDGIDVSSGASHSGYDLNPVLNECAWNATNSGMSTHPVGELQANSLQAYDMSGNVGEWCWDRYASDYYTSSPTDNPYGPDTGIYRVLRGGSFQRTTRTAVRLWLDGTYMNSDYGFRACRTVSTD